MNRSIAMIGGAIALYGALLTAPAGADTQFGMPAAADSPVTKTVRIDAKTRWVNVVQDDIVKFVVNGPDGEKTFAWNFSTGLHAVDLSKIAPAGLIDRVIYAYVARNPRYQCG